MTAEPDALRLVPLEPTEAMLWRGFDAKGAMTGLRHIHLIYRAMLAAAPAVQPAAGRSDWSDEDAKRYIADWCPDHVKDYIDRLDALAHPPAQGSESGGEPLTPDERMVLAWLAEEDVSSYGECYGSALDALEERGFVTITGDRKALLARVELTATGIAAASALSAPQAAPASGHDDHEDDEGRCDICGQAIKGSDLCATDVDPGPCHAACLEGAPVVDLETGEPDPDGKVFTYRWNDLPQPKAALGEGEGES